MRGGTESSLAQSAARSFGDSFAARFRGNTKTEKEVAMQMVPIDPFPQPRGCRITTLACFCAMLVLSAVSSRAQTKLDIPKLFAEHLRNAAPSAAFDTTNRVAAVSTQATDPVPIPGGLAPEAHIF